MIAGLESPTAGTLRIGGRVVDGVPPRKRDVAMVFQHDALYPHMTVRENMAFALKMRRMNKREIDGRVGWAAEMLGLRSLGDRKPGEISGGERRRVALGRAIVQKPTVFLLDEPLSNLDAGLRVDMRGQIKRLHRELGTTTIYVTHDQEEAMTLGDRVAVMCEGVVRQCDRPQSVYQQPVDRFVAGFLGTPAMNFVEGHLEVADGVAWFVFSDARLRLDGAPLEWLNGEPRRRIVAGIRPENIELVTSATDGDGNTRNDIAATVEMIEPVGSMMDVYLQTASGQRLLCRLKATGLGEGAPVAARVAPGDIYLFEPNGPRDRQSPAHHGHRLKVAGRLTDGH
jgi:multiple sugar transport system ATP-binding protein